jgi:hypothetical protein
MLTKNFDDLTLYSYENIDHTNKDLNHLKFVEEISHLMINHLLLISMILIR